MTEPRESAEKIARRRGMCPGVWRPMSSGDGLIVRVRTSARSLSAEQLRALAGLARSHGNGLIELTRRANLQLRGVRDDALASLQQELLALGLADPNAERERQLAPLLVSPRVGIVPDEDGMQDLALTLHDALVRGPHNLPSKLSVLLDGKERWLADVTADVRLAVRRDGLLGLSVAETEHSERLLGAVARADVGFVVAQLLALLSAAQDGHVRMRDFIARGGEAALREALGARLLAVALEPVPPPHPLIGFCADAPGWFGLSLPFGAGDGAAWLTVAELAERFGRGALRITPRRSVLLPGVQPGDVPALQALASRHGLITDPTDPLLRAVACAGAPACTSALGETRALASELAPLLAGRTLHVSGCEKSCAHGGAADITVLRSARGVQLGFGIDVPASARMPVETLENARRRLTGQGPEVRVRASMDPYEYERDGAEIYRRSFAIIRAEAELARFSRVEERVAVRLIHTSGMVDLAADVQFSPGFAEAAEAAIRRGAPIFCDANMIVSGVTRSRLSANNDVICMLDDPRVPALAKEQRTTRSAAALSLWGERLHGAVVAIGNAPTALFRMLELLDESALRPAAIIGLPVGFVGAAESKAALLSDGRVPSMIVRGRRGGSAMTVAAINALASDKE